ncbi:MULTISPECIES: aminotransferase class V-fold PLP-dependent enzyme [Sanguibacteroides]|uniref:Cysteine desulfurase n=1 Tax=Sanguibacteroides justesenii TaxID=1547597 RepID=A0A0C3R8M7_9PORP|nr:MULTISPECIES: cysteine desulfurase [Sanguibacteroides]KIO46805.1 cysteine sulfinate desulfinase [Sanguibacteroides justesenii]KIO46814.1 cysteine sulfinate desulfinase [Sanguibacteroides justesenii]PXZ43438.1 cysteine desulfurase [Sanguibacteroides justesenii]
MLDVCKIREDFPILEEKVYGKPLVYLDNGATSQRPRSVVEKMTEYYLRYNSNVHRGVHFLSNKCTDANEEAREIVREFIHAAFVEEVIFTRGTTESINLVAHSFGEAFIHEGDEILVTEMEHHANIVPWQMLCDRKKAVLKVVPFKDNGELDMQAFSALLSERVKLVAVAYVSNVLGTVNPVRRIIEAARGFGAYVLIDGAQAVQHIPVDVQDLDCDFFVFSGHKIYGPTGVGVLYGKKNLLEVLPPWQGGGEMIKEVRFEKTTYNDLPFKFEAGTPDFIGIIGLGEAIKYVDSVGLAQIAPYEHELLRYAMERMREIPNIRLYGEAPEKSSVISFGIEGIHHFDMGTLLDKMGIAVRTGQLCAEPVMQHYDVTGMVRASIGMYNTREEIDRLCEGVKKVEKLFRM